MKIKIILNISRPMTTLRPIPRYYFLANPILRKGLFNINKNFAIIKARNFMGLCGGVETLLGSV